MLESDYTYPGHPRALPDTSGSGGSGSGEVQVYNEDTLTYPDPPDAPQAGAIYAPSTGEWKTWDVSTQTWK